MKGRSATGPSPVDRGKAGSKHHRIVEAHGIPLAAITPGGNRNDVTPLIPLIQAVRPIRGSCGQPLRRPEHLYAGVYRWVMEGALTAPSSAGDDCAPHFVESKGGRSPQGMACSIRQNAFVAVGPAQPHIRALSTSTSQPGAKGSKPCSTSQRTISRLRNDHHAWITSRSMSVP